MAAFEATARIQRPFFRKQAITSILPAIFPKRSQKDQTITTISSFDDREPSRHSGSGPAQNFVENKPTTTLD